MKGRHRRPSKTSKAISGASTAALTGAAAATIAATSSTGGHAVIHATTTAYLQHHQPAAVQAVAAAPATYTIERGNTLTGIAEAHCGNAADWTGLYLSNKTTIGADPNVIEPSTRITLDCYEGTVTIAETPQEHWHHLNHLNHVALVAAHAPEEAPAAAPEQDAPVQQSAPVQEAQDAPVQQAPPVQQQQSTVNPGDYSGFQACVIKRESGGNADVMNSSGHYGLYQFSAGTWAGYGGNPADFGHASVAEQNQVFDHAMAQGGESNWSPYDGC
jgi:3D (Asp-Asp-Asp) domain-containing protein